jgi:hypothetical protein
MNYYLGNMDEDMPAPEGRSKTVSTDVADAVEGAMPILMDIFCGSDEVVRFEPVSAEDEEAAQQETDYVNHVFMQQNDGLPGSVRLLQGRAAAKERVCQSLVGRERAGRARDLLRFDEGSVRRG